jgi:hypothetical protein
MILAPDKRFIFIHVPKAAGTSINSALSMHDAFYPVRNHAAAARAAHAEKIGLPATAAALSEHASARDFIRVLGRETFAGYYSFAFVRNPWDVAVSWFHYRLINPAISGHKDAEAAGSFPAYVKKHLTGPDGPRLAGVQHPFVVDDAGDVAVSFVGRYESLEADYGLVKRLLKVETLTLDHFNQSYHPAWPSLYTRETFALVGALVARDAQLFGYAQDPAAYGIP